uniref:Putative mitochondrial fe/s cluster exporter abc superfamily protein n=1 Tax=Xenopsylla cheopis TaxID=163159 RepID=A0A6M2E035_XENCH
MAAVGFLLVSSAVSMAVPFSLGKVLDIIYNSTSDMNMAREQLNKLSLILLGVFLLGGACNYARVYLMSMTALRMTQSLRSQVFSSILKQEPGWFDTRSTGALINRLSADTQLVGQSISTNLSDGLRSTAMVAAGTGMMIYTSPELSLVALTIVPPLAGIAIFYGRFVRTMTRKVQDSLAATMQVAEEKIANIRTVKIFGKELQENNFLNTKLQEVLKLGYKESLAKAGFFGFTGFSGNVMMISVLYYGGTLVADSSITIGALTSFLLYAAYIGVSIGGLTSFYSELNKGIGAAERLWEIMDRQPLLTDNGIIPEKKIVGSIKFSNLSFFYPTRPQQNVFRDFSLNLPAGKVTALVGRSGSGKSTLGSLLLGLYEPQRGDIFLDDINIKELNLNWLRNNIGAVSQEPVLFSGTIRENILYGASDPDLVTESQLQDAMKRAHVIDFTQTLPDGVNTIVGERGIMLSGGQKQRVAIARAIIKDPAILILDEATSALDTHSERLIRSALEALTIEKTRTVLVIAHRLSTVKGADCIAVLKDGTIAEKGTYDELMNKSNGFFKELVLHPDTKVDVFS